MSEFPSSAEEALKSGWHMVGVMTRGVQYAKAVCLITQQFDDVWDQATFTRYGKRAPKNTKTVWVRGYKPTDEGIKILQAIYDADFRHLDGFIKNIQKMYNLDLDLSRSENVRDSVKYRNAKRYLASAYKKYKAKQSPRSLHDNLGFVPYRQRHNITS